MRVLVALIAAVCFVVQTAASSMLDSRIRQIQDLHQQLREIATEEGGGRRLGPLDGILIAVTASLAIDPPAGEAVDEYLQQLRECASTQTKRNIDAIFDRMIQDEKRAELSLMRTRLALIGSTVQEDTRRFEFVMNRMHRYTLRRQWRKNTPLNNFEEVRSNISKMFEDIKHADIHSVEAKLRATHAYLNHLERLGVSDNDMFCLCAPTFHRHSQYASSLRRDYEILQAEAYTLESTLRLDGGI